MNHTKLNEGYNMDAKKSENYEQLKKNLVPYLRYLRPSEIKGIMNQFEKDSRCDKNKLPHDKLKALVEGIIKKATKSKAHVEGLGFPDISEINFQEKIGCLQQNDCFLSQGDYVTLCGLMNYRNIGIEEKSKILKIEQKIQERKNSKLARAYPQLFDGNEPYLRHLIQPINQIFETDKNIDNLAISDINGVVELLYGNSEKYKFKLADLTKLISIKNALCGRGILQDTPSSRFLEDATFKEFKRVIQDSGIGLKEELASRFPTQGIETYITEILKQDNGILKKMMHDNQKARKHDELKAGMIRRIDEYDGKYAPVSFFSRDEIQIINSDDELGHLVINKRKEATDKLSDREIQQLLSVGGTWYYCMPDELKQHVDKRRENILERRMKVKNR